MWKGSEKCEHIMRELRGQVEELLWAKDA